MQRNKSVTATKKLQKYKKKSNLFSRTTTK